MAEPPEAAAIAAASAIELLPCFADSQGRY
jgi:hypothetical protein